MTAQFIQLGPFFDDGELCGAALLYHYEAGTSTEKPIWSEASQVPPSQLEQPFVSDGDGIFNFYAQGSYKFIIQKADGTLLHTCDNWSIESSGSSASGLSGGPSVVTASNMDLSTFVWAHWTGSNNVSTLSGSAPFYWAMADGNFTLIHSASLRMPDARNRKVLTGDVLFFVNETAGVFRLGGHLQTEGGWTGRMGASVAAGATLAVPTDGDFIDLSGTTPVTAIATAPAGYRFRVRCTGTGLNFVHHAVSLISPWGYDYLTIQNEIIECQSLGGGNWMFYSINGPKEQVGHDMIDNGPTGTRGGLLKDGASYLRADYPGLFAKIGTVHGSVDATHFNVPDDRGRTGIMVDGTANRITSASTGGANADTLGGTGGAQTHTLTLAETPANSVNYTAVRNVAGGVCAAGGDKGEQTNSLNVGGSGGAHSNTQPWITTLRYIRF